MSFSALFSKPSGKYPASDFDWAGEDNWDMSCEVPEFMRGAQSSGAYTPDLPSLMQRERQLVFVYGTLKEGFRNNRALKGSHFVGYASTGNNYNMFVTTGTEAPFPVVFLEGQKGRAGAIFGEVYSVVPSCLRALDYLESNGTLYKRFPTPVWVANKDGSTQKLYAWMYKGLQSFWSTRQTSLRQCKPNVPKSNPTTHYYMFKQPDAIAKKK